MEMIRWYLVAGIIAAGVFGLFLNRRTLAKVIAVNVINSGLVLLFVLLGAESGNRAPILFTGEENVVDPLVQALMLTAIVVGVCVTALLLVLVVRMHRITGTTDIVETERTSRDAEG
ncbi:MAG: NADH-quinone oxidoreductase subunit K [Alkalispirochaetaceae bacterium]